MALYKNVNGEQVICSPEEEAAFNAEWFANDPANKTQSQIDSEMLEQVTSKFNQDKLYKLLFEVIFNHENRIRTLEGMPVITRAQLRVALKNIWASL